MFPVVAVHHPRRAGAFSAHRAGLGPREKEWFDVYGNEDRQPGEWGHWAGRGMNWNSMCATCHHHRVPEELRPGRRPLRLQVRRAGRRLRVLPRPAEKARRVAKGPSRRALLRRQDRQDAHPRSVPVGLRGLSHSRRGDLTGAFEPGTRTTTTSTPPWRTWATRSIRRADLGRGLRVQRLPAQLHARRRRALQQLPLAPHQQDPQDAQRVVPRLPPLVDERPHPDRSRGPRLPPRWTRAARSASIATIPRHPTCSVTGGTITA